MLAQAYFCNTAPAKYSPSAGTVCPQRLPIYRPYFSLFCLPHHSPASCVGTMEPGGGRMPKSVACYPSPPSHVSLGLRLVFPTSPTCFPCLGRSAQLCLNSCSWDKVQMSQTILSSLYSFSTLLRFTHINTLTYQCTSEWAYIWRAC